MAPKLIDTTNHLLSSLPTEELASLAPKFTFVKLDLRQRLECPDDPIKEVYFFESGLGSIVAKADGREVEVGLIGREGMSGTALVLGDHVSPYDVFMQAEGSGWRISSDDFLSALTENASMNLMAKRFARVLGIQTSFTALANAHLKLEERLCRWLLMVHDRIGRDRFNVTHEFLSVMLGVRRPGVTVALHILEGKGLIKSLRGEIVVIDRQGLILETQGTYGIPEQSYQRLIGVPFGG